MIAAGFAFGFLCVVVVVTVLVCGHSQRVHDRQARAHLRALDAYTESVKAAHTEPGAPAVAEALAVEPETEFQRWQRKMREEAAANAERIAHRP